MSLGYAEKLSYREDVGSVGMPEMLDDPVQAEAKILELAQLILRSRHTVAFTGAGISTSCGIPDFRGPKGIWTLQKDGRAIPQGGVPFDRARPGPCHMALRGLLDAALVHFLVSQNVDGLHLRSAVPRGQLAELHGNCFRETCRRCQAEYFRDFEVETIGLKPTGRQCSQEGCRGKLADSVLDWEDELPPEELKAAEKHCKSADLVLCLGTSLQITPACDLPLKAVRAGGKMVIVNLQATPKDRKAALVIRRPVDEVMRRVMELLQLPIPPFIRVHRVLVSLSATPTGRNKMSLNLRLESSHGRKAPLPFINAVKVSFPDEPTEEPVTLGRQPFCLKKSLPRRSTCQASICLHLEKGCGCTEAYILVTAPLQSGGQPCDTVDGGSPDSSEKAALDALLTAAERSGRCGAVSMLRRTRGGCEYALVTDVALHCGGDAPPRAAGGEEGRETDMAAPPRKRSKSSALRGSEQLLSLSPLSPTESKRASTRTSFNIPKSWKIEETFSM